MFANKDGFVLIDGYKRTGCDFVAVLCFTYISKSFTTTMSSDAMEQQRNNCKKVDACFLSLNNEWV
jgi:hypothetical protein